MRYAVSLESDKKSKILSAAKNYDMIVVDAQDYTAAEIKQLKSGGAKVLSYINVGAVEADRSYFNATKSNGLLICEYDNWPDEYWVKAQSSKWRAQISTIADALEKKGIDGYWVDNLDIYYMADEEWKWSSSKKQELFESINTILKDLHKRGYVMINGGDVYVSKALKLDTFDGINQETVFTSITDYDPPGEFGKQSADEREYFTEYADEVSKAGKDVFFLEYTKDETLKAEAEKYCEQHGFSIFVSSVIELGGDITVATTTNTTTTTTTTETSTSGTCTVWDVLVATSKYDGSSVAHEDTIATLKKHGHSVSASDAWCTEQVMAIFYDAGGIDLIGGYASNSTKVRDNAKKLGIWHEGSSNILPGDIVIFGKNGKPNHTELAVGASVNVSGNYNGGTSRRERTSHSSTILGYVHPKYEAMPTMNNLQLAIVASDVMLGVYKTSKVREKMLSVFGSNNASLIQSQTVNSMAKDLDVCIFNMAVATIAGFMGKNAYRKTRLGGYTKMVQEEINSIYDLRGKSTDAVVEDVLANKYSKEEIRILLLGFCGYNPTEIQSAVNEALSATAKKAETVKTSGGSITIWPIWFFESDEAQFGDSTAIIEYGADGKTIEHVVLIDTAKKGADVVKKLKNAGVKDIDAVVISHAHGDHYGALSDIFKNFNVGALYLPNIDGLSKYQSSYASAIKNQAKKADKYNAKCVYMQKGTTFSYGNISCKCIYQVDASDLEEHDDHHFVNNMSIVLMFDVNGWKYYTAGDCQNEANAVIVKKAGDIKADIFKCQWHGDRNAISRDLAKKIKPLIGYSNYHHLERSGRKGTREVLEDVGAVVARNSENGDIYINCKVGEMTLKCSKENLSKVFRKG